MNSDILWKVSVVLLFGLTIFTSWYGNRLVLKALASIEAILMAASPDLLEALEFAIDNVHLGTGPRYTEAIERMTEAIQKAKQ